MTLPVFFMVIVVVSGVPAGTWSSVPTNLLMAQVAELVPTVPPEPDPVEKQLVAPWDSSSCMVPAEKVLELLTICALKPASDVIAVVDSATTASDAVASAPNRADADLNLNMR